MVKNRRIFTKTSKTGFISQRTDERPVIEEDVRTLEIESDEDRYIVYELERDGTQTPVRTFKKSEYSSKEEVIKGIKNDSIFLRRRHTLQQRTSYGFINWIQSNYPIRQMRLSTAQLVCLVRVKEVSSGRTDYFTGYSRKFSSPKFNDKELDIARKQCRDMAVQKFIDVYGYPKRYRDERDELIGYEDLSDNTFYDSAIIEERYQYIQRREY